MTDPQTDRELIAEAREFFGYAYECGDFDDWERAARMVPVLDRILEALTARLEQVKAIHRPVHAVFNWQAGLRYEEPCEQCHGKAGVHGCGCWADEDIEFICFECSRQTDPQHFRRIAYPCPTIQAIEKEA